MEYYETLDKYVRISNELYREFDKIFKRKEECQLTFINDDNEISIKSKISKFTDINGSEFMDTSDGKRIRLDKIVALNGHNTKDFNNYS